MHVRTVLLSIVFAAACAAADNQPALWRDPGPIGSLNLANGPGSQKPQPPFTFVEEIKTGFTPKVIVTDAKGTKWVAKFGQEAKAEVFASRIAWAAGYPARVSHYVTSGKIVNMSSGKHDYVRPDGTFDGARFQLFDNDRFKAVDGHLDLQSKSLSGKELNGLRLTALLTGNWDVKRDNTAVFEIDGQRYATISDWGATMGDPGAADREQRKWHCEGYTRTTDRFIEGVQDGHVLFNYEQYAGRHIDALTQGITLSDVKWYTDRMSKLSDAQIKAALRASGATAEETSCFASALRRRIQMLADAADGRTDVIRSRTIRTIRKPVQQD